MLGEIKISFVEMKLFLLLGDYEERIEYQI
jgi:hypothetical protein